MNNDDLLPDFHIGRLIKAIADEKHVSSKKIAEALVPPRYRDNADKIFKLQDIDVEDLQRISEILDHNLLATISEKYLSHILFTGCNVGKEFNISLKFETNKIEMMRKTVKNAQWKNAHIGGYINEIVQTRRLKKVGIAKQLGCNPSLLSYYYKSKSLTLKPLIKLSIVLNHNLIAEFYLIRMNNFDVMAYYDNSIIRLHAGTGNLINQNTGTFELTFPPNPLTSTSKND